jgi:hypothetical protein
LGNEGLLLLGKESLLLRMKQEGHQRRMRTSRAHLDGPHLGVVDGGPVLGIGCRLDGARRLLLCSVSGALSLLSSIITAITTLAIVATLAAMIVGGLGASSIPRARAR